MRSACRTYVRRWGRGIAALLAAWLVLSALQCMAATGTEPTDGSPEVDHANSSPRPGRRSDAMLDKQLLDENGVAMWQRGSTVYYNGVNLCQVAIAAFRDHERSGDPRYLCRAVSHADKFLDMCVSRGQGAVVFPYPVDHPPWGARAGEWSSGMAQGLALTVMVRAHRHTGRTSYLEAAHSIFTSLQMTIDEGGVLGRWADGSLAIEELAQPGEPGAKILNGFVAALKGVVEYADYTDSREAHVLARQCLHSIQKHIAEYDFGYWSAYDQFGTYAREYNETHCRQLVWCYERTGHPIFLQYALKFASYACVPPMTVSLVEGDPRSFKAGYGIDNVAFPEKPGKRYLSYTGPLPVTLEVDLRTQYYLAGVQFAARAARCVPTAYTILASSDRSNWRAIARRTDDPLVHKLHFFDRARLYRYLRLRIEGSSAGDEQSGWFTIDSIRPTVRLPIVAEGKQYAHSLLPGINGGNVGEAWSRVQGHGRIYYDLVGIRRLRGLRVKPGPSQKNPISVRACASLGGYLWHEVSLSAPEEECGWWLAESPPLTRYLRLDITQRQKSPLFLADLEVAADGDLPAVHPDVLRPSFAGQIDTVAEISTERLNLLGTSRPFPPTIHRGGSFRLDLFLECQDQFVSDAPYAYKVILRRGGALMQLSTHRLRGAHSTRSWAGLQFRELLHETVSSDIAAGDYELLLDLGQTDAEGGDYRSLLPEGPVAIGTLTVVPEPR